MLNFTLEKENPATSYEMAENLLKTSLTYYFFNLIDLII